MSLCESKSYVPFMNLIYIYIYIYDVNDFSLLETCVQLLCNVVGHLFCYSNMCWHFGIKLGGFGIWPKISLF